jgi:oxygen-independent coproporphyrinogen-3 oxidase
LHIPFCLRKCHYCDFLSFPTDDEGRKAYILALVKEMKLQVSTQSVDTIFIGGGTPSILEPSEMDLVFQGLYDCFDLSGLKEFTIECNPGTVTAEKFALYRQGGVNRISFGMQSAIDKELKLLGRIHDFDEFLCSYRMARKEGFDNINIDIMSAIPGQTKESYDTTLSRVLDLEPEHISSYSLIIEEGTPFYDWYAEKPPVDEETDRWLYERTGERLADAGFQRYEISNYAVPGKSCRHNLKYWQREDYLGLGLGASSFCTKGGTGKRFSNVTDMDDYIKRVMEREELPLNTESVEILTKKDEMAEFMYLGLRCMEGVSEKKFQQCFGKSMRELYGKEISFCVEQGGLLEQEGDFVRLTNRGIDVSNRVFAMFL